MLAQPPIKTVLEPNTASDSNTLPSGRAQPCLAPVVTSSKVKGQRKALLPACHPCGRRHGSDHQFPATAKPPANSGMLFTERNHVYLGCVSGIASCKTCPGTGINAYGPLHPILSLPHAGCITRTFCDRPQPVACSAPAIRVCDL